MSFKGNIYYQPKIHAGCPALLTSERGQDSAQSSKPKVFSFQNTCPKDTWKVAKFHRDTKRTPWVLTMYTSKLVHFLMSGDNITRSFGFLVETVTKKLRCHQKSPKEKEFFCFVFLCYITRFSILLPSFILLAQKWRILWRGGGTLCAPLPPHSW